MLGRDDRLARRLELVALVSAPTPEIASHITLIPKGQRFQDAKTHFFIFNECCTDGTVLVRAKCAKRLQIILDKYYQI
jgi:hypothetical protein